MFICTYNVNGIQHFVKQGFLRRLFLSIQPDILFLQELKIRGEKLARFRSFHLLCSEYQYSYCYFQTCDKPNTGYSGVGILSKIQPLSVQTGWSHSPDADDDEGRVISCVFPECVFLNVYVVCLGFNERRKEEKLCFHKLLSAEYSYLCRKHGSKPVFLTGDLNAALQSDDWYDGATNAARSRHPSFYPWERKLLWDFIKNHNLLDSYIALNPKAGSNRFTYFETLRHRKRRQGCRIDYFLSPRCFHDNVSVTDIWTNSGVSGSDHVPLFVRLHFRQGATVQSVSAAHSPVKASRQDVPAWAPSQDVIVETPRPENIHANGLFSVPDDWDDIVTDDSPVTETEQDGILFSSLRKAASSCGAPVSFNSCHPLATGALSSLRSKSAPVAIKATVPMAKILIMDRLLDCLFDSGASYSCISRDTIFSMFGRDPSGWKKYIVPNARLPVFELANGEKDQALALMRLDVHLSPTRKKPWRQEFYVMAMKSVHVIFGVDFFCKTGALLNFTRKVINLPKVWHCPPLRFSITPHRNTFTGAILPIFLLSDLRLQSGTEIVTDARLSDDCSLFCPNVSGVGVVERLHHGVDPRHILATSISCLTNGYLSVQIANLTRHDSFLRKGSIIGYYRPATIISPEEAEYYDESNTDVINVISETSRGVDDSSVSEAFIRGIPAEMSSQGTSASSESETSPQYLSYPAPDEPVISVPLPKLSTMAFTHSKRLSRLLSDCEECVSCDDNPSFPSLRVLDLGRVAEPPQPQYDSDGIPVGLDLSRARSLLSKHQFKKLTRLIVQYRDIFAHYYGEARINSEVEMDIEIPPDTKPVWDPIRPMNPKQRLVLVDWTRKLRDQGIIEPSDSPWNTNVFFVPKKNGKLRCVQDLKRVNALTKNIPSTLPRIADCLGTMGGAKWFSVWDLSAAYYGVGLSKKSRAYTAFTTPIGRYQWTRSVMGLKNSQQFLIHLTNYMLSDLQYECVMIYSDDGCCYSPSFEQHLIDLEKLFQRLRKCNVAIAVKKSIFCTDKVQFCGFVVDADGVHIDPSSVSAIRDMPEPKTLKELRALLGCFGWWRRFIAHFAEIAAPLRALLKHGAFVSPLPDDAKAAILVLKERLSSPPVLAHPDWNLPWEIHTDGSPSGIGAVLLQLHADKVLRAVCYFSRALTEVQRAYHQFDIESLAVLTSLEVFRPYITGSKVKIVTDSEALSFLLKPEAPLSNRRLRWFLRISEFDFWIEHRSAKKHLVPDCLSRLHLNQTLGPLPKFDPNDDQPDIQLPIIVPRNTTETSQGVDDSSVSEAFIRGVPAEMSSQGFDDSSVSGAFIRGIPADMSSQGVHVSSSIDTLDVNLSENLSESDSGSLCYVPDNCSYPFLFVTLPDCVKHDLSKENIPRLFVRFQSSDPDCQHKISRTRVACNCPAHLHSNDCFHSRFMLNADNVLVHIRVLPKSSDPPHQLCVPQALVSSVLFHFHGLPISGHCGIRRTISSVRRHFWWKGLSRDVIRWIRACVPCQRRTRRVSNNSVQPGSLLAHHPWDIVAIDIVGPLFETVRGNTCILTVIDVFTRYPFAIPLPNHVAETVVRALFEHVFQHFSFPRGLVSDNGPEFVGKIMKAFSKLFGIQRIRTVPNTPSLNGCIENFHRYLNASLTVLTNRYKNNWDERLPMAMLAFRGSTHTSLGHYSPFQAMFGRSPTTSMDLALTSAPVFDSVPSYVRHMCTDLREIHSSIRSDQLRAAQVSIARRLRDFKPREFKVNDYVMVLDPRSEKLPNHMPRIKKLLDKNNGPFRIIEVLNSGSRRKYKLDLPGGPAAFRSNILGLYEPWYDGNPSVPAREGFSSEERRTINAQKEKHFCKIIEKGDLVVFPRTMSDGTAGFGVAKAMHKLSTGGWNCQWYSNDLEEKDPQRSLTLTFRPCWRHNEPGKWYTRSVRSRRHHQPLMTADTFAPVEQSMCADVGFSLTDGCMLPESTLQRMLSHRLFKWRLRAEH